MRMVIPLSVAMPLSNLLDTYVILLGFPMLIEGRELLANLVLLDVMDFRCDSRNGLVISVLCHS